MTTKPICSICYQDLNPILEDLQAISICGHVFHEPCIQQWFECCSKEKKKCPICKRTCSASKVSRLYFQSVGDSDDSNLSQKLQTHKDDPRELKLEVRRLELKVNVLNSALESRENDIGGISSELCVCKEMLKEEASQKNKTEEQTDKRKALLKSIDEELINSDKECTKLEENNMALAKELAALKLVSDFDLKEDEIVKLASLGTKPNTKETVDILHKSLGARQKSYTDLYVKYNKLKKARSCKELENAKKQLEEIELEKKIQKLGTVKEMKDNEVLRALNASIKTKKSLNVLNGVNSTLNRTCTPQDTIKEHAIHPEKTKRKRVCDNINESDNKDGVSSSYISKSVHETSEHNGAHWHDCKDDDDDMVFVHKPLLNIVKEASSPVVNPQEADFGFSNGLLDGTIRHPGTWCKKGQSKNPSGDLIAVGADGRGGTVKILKSHNSSSLNSRGSSVYAKSGKIGPKTSSLQSRGSLRIDHYFSKTGS